MTTPRAVFVDFDGTYADHGAVPEAHVAAVGRVRSNGHLVFLCTGRPKSMVAAHVLDGIFDGLVAAAGGYAEMGGRVLSDIRFPRPLAQRLIDLLEGAGVLYVLEAPLATYALTGSLTRLQTLLDSVLDAEEGPRDILAGLQLVESFAGQSFGKATCFESPVPLTEIADLLRPEVALLPSSLHQLGPGSGEFYLPHVTKAVGIEVITRRLGLSAADVIAIGDGYNDLEMLQHAGVGVAVRTAPAEVRQHADLLIDGPDEHGLVEAFTTLGLI